MAIDDPLGYDEEMDLLKAEGDDPLGDIPTGEEQQRCLERTLPQNVDAERALLSAIMRDNSLLENRRVAKLDPKDFFRDAHNRIFSAMRTLRQRDVPIDFITLLDEIERVGDRDEIGGQPYLETLRDEQSGNEAEAYAHIIWEKCQIRNLIFVLNRGLTLSYDADRSARKIYASVLREVWAMTERLLDP